MSSTSYTLQYYAPGEKSSGRGIRGSRNDTSGSIFKCAIRHLPFAFAFPPYPLPLLSSPLLSSPHFYPSSGLPLGGRTCLLPDGHGGGAGVLGRARRGGGALPGGRSGGEGRECRDVGAAAEASVAPAAEGAQPPPPSQQGAGRQH
jgi:hypothetical protein